MKFEKSVMKKTRSWESVKKIEKKDEKIISLFFNWVGENHLKKYLYYCIIFWGWFVYQFLTIGSEMKSFCWKIFGR